MSEEVPQWGGPPGTRFVRDAEGNVSSVIMARRSSPEDRERVEFTIDKATGEPVAGKVYDEAGREHELRRVAPDEWEVVR